MHEEVFNWRRLPAVLDAQQTARLLGIRDYHLPILIKAKLLFPLGRPAPNSAKLFCASEIQQLASDRAWLDKAIRTLEAKWQKKNEAAREKLAINNVENNNEMVA